MGYKKYVLIVLLCGLSVLVRAQSKSYMSADSTTDSLLNAGNWKDLAVKCNYYLANGADYASLRLKLGYAQFMLGNFSEAIRNYKIVLRNDSYNQTARYYMYFCYEYLNNQSLAGAQLAKLDTNSLKVLHKSPNALVSAGLESSFKIADDPYRGNAWYSQFDISNRLFSKLQVYEAVSYFGQYIYDFYDRKWRQNPDRQTEYYLKMSYPLTDNLTVTGGWHYLYTIFETDHYHSNLFTGGLNYATPYFNLQADADAGHLTTDKVAQYNGRIFVNPLGNLNLYFISGVSYLHKNSTDNFIFSETGGFKAFNGIWLETSGTFGNLDDYIEAGGLYIYNTFDATKLKLAETVYMELSKSLMLNLSYTYEKKRDGVQDINYNQNSIAAGIVWKF
jgi:hypothetical protein